MKRNLKAQVGLVALLIACVWAGVRSIPNAAYRYEHPKLTDTELQIYFLSSLNWWDLIPAALATAGMILIYWEDR